MLLGGIYAAKHLLALPAPVSATLARLLLALLVVSSSVWVASLLGRALELRGARAGQLRPAFSTGVVRTLVQIVVWAIGTLALLSALGISVTPLLTTMGLGALAVALGLRETLANLFAGMNFMLAGNINIGDFVKLSSGEEGTIEDIQWRVTRVRTQFDTMVLIPNNRLADNLVTNYHQPTSRVAVVVPVRVHSASDLDQVERVTRAVARRIVATVPGRVPDVEPLIRYRAFGDSSVDFNVIFRVHTYPDTQLVRHEFIKALVRAYAAEEIVIPFPVRAINLAQEGAAAELSPRRPAPPQPRFDDH